MILRIDWSVRARADLRSIDRETAVAILHALTRYVRTGQGDVAALHGEFAGALRLRVGDWRVRLRRLSPDHIQVLRVHHRSAAYR